MVFLSQFNSHSSSSLNDLPDEILLICFLFDREEHTKELNRQETSLATQSFSICWGLEIFRKKEKRNLFFDIRWGHTKLDYSCSLVHDTLLLLLHAWLSFVLFLNFILKTSIDLLPKPRTKTLMLTYIYLPVNFLPSWSPWQIEHKVTTILKLASLKPYWSMIDK